MTPSVEELLSTGPQGIRQWMASHKDDVSLAQTFHWQGLAESAARRARTSHDVSLAAAAIDVYRHWAMLSGVSGQESARLSIMFLRAFFIRDLGEQNGDPVRDVKELVRAFEDGLSLTIHEAAELSAAWPSLPVEKIKNLRRIKDRLGAFELLNPALLDSFPSIKEWLAIRDDLP